MFHVIIPPRMNAKIRKNKEGKYLSERSHYIEEIKKHGVMNWQKKTDYGE